MYEMESCETCAQYKPYPNDKSHGTCGRWCKLTFRDKWCKFYKHYLKKTKEVADGKILLEDNRKNS